MSGCRARALPSYGGILDQLQRNVGEMCMAALVAIGPYGELLMSRDQRRRSMWAGGRIRAT